jgi:hypothetical protein
MFLSRDSTMIARGIGMMILGILVYLATAYMASWFPFSAKPSSGE